MWVLWAAYKEGSFPLIPEMDKESFYGYTRENLKSFSSLMLVEDECKKFKAGRGPVCLIVANTDGWKVEPHVEFFKWATPRNILRVNVRFFNWMRQNKGVGVCIVKSLKETSNLFHRVRQYGVLFYVGCLVGGDIRGNEFIFSICGGKRIDGADKTTKGLQRDSDGGEQSSTSTIGSNGDSGEKVLRQ